MGLETNMNDELSAAIQNRKSSAFVLLNLVLPSLYCNQSQGIKANGISESKFNGKVIQLSIENTVQFCIYKYIQNSFIYIKGLEVLSNVIYFFSVFTIKKSRIMNRTGLKHSELIESKSKLKIKIYFIKTHQISFTIFRLSYSKDFT